MSTRGPWRWSVVALVFVLSLSAMVMAQRWYEGRRTVPALNQLESIPGVTWARVGNGAGGRTLWVAVQPVEDVPGLVAQLRRAALSGGLGPIDELVLVDNRDEALSRALATLSLALQEGAYSGEFTRMRDRVTAEAERLGIAEARVYVDSQAVYLLLLSHGHHLYEVVMRPPVAGPTASAPSPGLRAEGPLAVPAARPGEAP